MEIKKETVEAGEVLKGVLLSPFGDFPKSVSPLQTLGEMRLSARKTGRAIFVKVR